jgi:TRAP-type C4-dicarboxylate transport system substrate-binding protein
VLLRCLAHPGLLLFVSLVAAGASAPAVAVDVPDFRLKVVAHDASHLAWSAASRLADAAGKNALKIQLELASKPGEQASNAAAPDLLVMPLHSLATRMPALEILELPFFYADIDAVHQAIDGGLGKLLRDQVRHQGWELLAFWDEGMHALSGNRRYDTAINLTGMEFILLRPDPIAEKLFKAFDAWTRPARPQTREQLLRECMIGSRSASLQQLWHERLDRVHLDLSLTAHRYEGWVVLAPVAAWNKHSEADRAALVEVLASMATWQRADARRREEEALHQLETSGMTVHRLTAEQRSGFLERLPAWEALLSDSLEQTLRQKLVATATTGVVKRAPDKKALPEAKPATPGG